MRITGESAAIQIKNYIESHSYLENTDIILLVISDHEYLLRKVNQIQKNKGLCVESVMSVNYDAIYAYLEEQLEGFDLQLLKKILPKTILRIKKVLHGLSSDQEVGLFMHITC